MKQITVAIILGLKLGNDKELTKGFSIIVVTTICLFVAAFGWSWGPLGWTVPSEIFPLETRSAGQSITVAVNLLFTFIIAQSFLSLLCAFKFGIFLFFSGWIMIMTIFVYVFLPETKGVPLEEMLFLWRKHWFWKKIVCGDQEEEETAEDGYRESIWKRSINPTHWQVETFVRIFISKFDSPSLGNASFVPLSGLQFHDIKN